MDTAGVSIPYAVLMGRASRLNHSPSDYKQDRHLSHMGRVAKVATHSALHTRVHSLKRFSVVFVLVKGVQGCVGKFSKTRFRSVDCVHLLIMVHRGTDLCLVGRSFLARAGVCSVVGCALWLLVRHRFTETNCFEKSACVRLVVLIAFLARGSGSCCLFAQC